MKYGYIRVSTVSQDYLRQQLQLEENGVTKENIFEEKVSGTKKAFTRPAFEEMLGKLVAGDECVFESMSRMARSMQDLIDTTNFLVRQKKVKVIFLKENLVIGDSNSQEDAMSTLLFNIMGAFAQFERDLIADRTKQGIRARREMNPNFKIGHPVKRDVSNDQKIRAGYKAGRTLKDLADYFGLSVATVHRIVKKR